MRGAKKFRNRTRVENERYSNFNYFLKYIRVRIMAPLRSKYEYESANKGKYTVGVAWIGTSTSWCIRRYANTCNFTYLCT